MAFYRDFIQNRLKNVEESLLATSELLSVEEDGDIEADTALANLANLIAQADLAKATLITMAAGEVYRIGQTYQTIDAADRADFQADADGIADVVKGGNGDEYLHYNPAPIGIGHGYSHPAYPRVIARVPIKHIHRLGPPGLFNGCLLRYGDKSLFTCRTKGFPSKTYIYRPDVDMLFADPKEFAVPMGDQFSSAEDVRLLRYEGTTLASFTMAGQTGTGWICRMALAEVSDERELSWSHIIDSPTAAPVEKNWVFFASGTRLFCVYYPAPHIVYEVHVKTGQVTLGQSWEATNWQSADFMENARGGASPICVGDEFYHFYHTQHRHGRGVSYQVGLYTFEARPPWNIARIVKGPLLSMIPSKRDLDVVFPCGAELHNDTWTLSCGVQDHETMAISLGFDDLERLLTKV